MCHIVKMHFSYKKSSFLLQGKIKQTKYIVKMTKEGSTKIVTSMTSRVRVFALVHGHISHKVEMHFSYKNLLEVLYSQA